MSLGPETVFLKLGGSLITEKTQKEAPRRDVLARVADETVHALRKRPALRLVLGHGSGSYGHVAAERYGIHRGCPADWRGYAETSAAAARLDRLVVDAFLAAGAPVVALQPSASARAVSGRLVEMATWPLQRLLERGLVPIVYGDVALDDAQGCCIISTESIFELLAAALDPDRILLAGEVDGVYTGDPLRDPKATRLANLTPEMWDAAQGQLAGARGVDVTGGMRSKVRQMLDLVARRPGLEVWIFSGLVPGRIEAALLGNPGGTRLMLHQTL